MPVPPGEETQQALDLLEKWLSSDLVRLVLQPEAAELAIWDDRGVDNATQDAIPTFGEVAGLPNVGKRLAEIQDLVDITVATQAEAPSDDCRRLAVRLHEKLLSPERLFACSAQLSAGGLEFDSYLGGAQQLALSSFGAVGRFRGSTRDQWKRWCETGSATDEEEKEKRELTASLLKNLNLRIAPASEEGEDVEPPDDRPASVDIPAVPYYEGLWLLGLIEGVSERAALAEFARCIRIVCAYLTVQGLADLLPPTGRDHRPLLVRPLDGDSCEIPSSDTQRLRESMVTKLYPDRWWREKMQRDQAKESHNAGAAYFEMVEQRLVGLPGILDKQDDEVRPLVNALDLLGYACDTTHDAVAIAVTFSALEGLYAGEGSIQASLAAKVAGLLSRSARKAKDIEARIKSLYDVRSDFVHQKQKSKGKKKPSPVEARRLLFEYTRDLLRLEVAEACEATRDETRTWWRGVAFSSVPTGHHRRR